MDIVAILRKMRTVPTSLEIEVQDEREPGHPGAIKKLHLVYRVTGPVPEENLKKAISLSLSAYCPIANSLSGVAEITTAYVIHAGQ